MIRPADARDIAMILRYLAATDRPPNESEMTIGAILERTDEACFVDDTHALVCRMVPAPAHSIVSIPWMLPRADWQDDNFPFFAPLVLATGDELVRRVPAVRGWDILGEFDGGPGTREQRLAKSREIVEFWRDNGLPEVQVFPSPDRDDLYRGQVSLQYLRDTLRKAVRRV